MHDHQRPGSQWGFCLFGLALIVIAGAAYYYTLDWVAQLRKGPTPVTAEEILAMSEGKEPPSRWVTYTAKGEVIQTDVRLAKYKMPIAKYVLVPVGKRYLIAQVNPSYVGQTFSGTLGVWTNGKQAEAVPMITQSVGNASGRILHFQLDGQQNPADQITPVYIMLAMVAGLGGVFIIGGLMGPSKPPMDPYDSTVPEFSVQPTRDKATWLPR
jgi:hypothetical protein